MLDTMLPARLTRRFGVISFSETSMKRIGVLLSLLVLLAMSSVCQTQRTVSWDGYVQRGRVKVRAGGSGWSVNGESVSHTEEIYESSDAARYVLSRLKGKMRPSSEIAPNAGSLQFKVTTRNSGSRIAWVCSKDLHYLQAKSYAAALALLASWGPFKCD
jgi:hypothetical protein